VEIEPEGRDPTSLALQLEWEVCQQEHDVGPRKSRSLGCRRTANISFRIVG
jgi:hypothetical protein